MNETDILTLTYEDTVTVYRAFKDILPSGESIFKEGLDGKIVYQEEMCALSRQTGGKLNRTESVAVTPTDYSLFTRPEIDIQPNDHLVISHLGRKTLAVAGLAVRLSSHNNVPLKLDKEMV